jgi:hypothetical protein
VVVGSYGIRICEGEVTIASAVLLASETVHWVHGPHCHALPVLRATANAVIELHPHPAAKSLRQLGKLNPAFGKLWNETSQDPASDKAGRAAATFQIVRLPFPLGEARLTKSRYILRRIALRELSCRIWSHQPSGTKSSRALPLPNDIPHPLSLFAGPSLRGSRPLGGCC